MRKRGQPTTLLVWLFLAGTAGFAQEPAQQSSPVVPDPSRPGPVSEEVTPSADGPSAPVDPKAYRIGPEDVLRIQVWREPELSGLVTVRPDGMITVNLAGDIQVNGMTPEALSARLKEEYSKFINNPIVQVAVQAVRSKKYYVAGQIQRTGAFPLIVPTTVMQALAQAGSFSDFANRKKIVIMRGDKRFTFNYNEVVKGKNLAQNIYLENGDFIIVP
jgi:polysaccharide export outer membrane protein